MSDDDLVRSFARARRAVARALPELAGLTRAASIVVRESTATVAVFENANIVVNPTFWRSLSDDDRVFVLAHELQHVLLRTARRSTASTRAIMNAASDAYINDALSDRLGVPIPADGVVLPGARHLSTENIALRFAQTAPPPAGAWNGGDALSGGELDDAASRPSASAAIMNPSASPSVRKSREVRSREGRAWYENGGEAVDIEQIDVCEVVPQDRTSLHRLTTLLRPHCCWGRYTAKELTPTPTWLSRLSSMGAPRGARTRTWARPSRRNRDPGWLMPGRRPSRDVPVVLLDVSTSMVRYLGRAIGAIRALARRSDVGLIRVVQATSGGATRDEVLAPAALSSLTIEGEMDEEVFIFKDVCPRCKGRHGAVASDAPHTDLRAAVEERLFDESPSTLAFTDGRVLVPRHGAADWTWLVFGDHAFAPGWGTVLRVG